MNFCLLVCVFICFVYVCVVEGSRRPERGRRIALGSNQLRVLSACLPHGDVRQAARDVLYVLRLPTRLQFGLISLFHFSVGFLGLSRIL